MYSKIRKDQDNKEFNLYIDIGELKKLLKEDYLYRDKNKRYYRKAIDYICNNLHDEEDINKYLKENYYNHTYTYEELYSMEYDKRIKIMETDAACRRLYDKQLDYYNEEINVKKLKCKECGNIQDTYPGSNSERRCRDSICNRCGSSIYVDIDTRLNKYNDIICCNDEISNISMFTDSFKNCYATHVYECSKCNKKDTVYIFKEI